MKMLLVKAAGDSNRQKKSLRNIVEKHEVGVGNAKPNRLT